jgi:hypothetical protein
MKFLHLLVSTLPLCGTPLHDQKLCVNCIFFTKDFLSKNRYGKCSFFLVDNSDNNYHLVDGSTKVDPPTYHYCSTARKYENMCGEEGLLYIQRKKGFGYK